MRRIKLKDVVRVFLTLTALSYILSIEGCGKPKTVARSGSNSQPPAESQSQPGQGNPTSSLSEAERIKGQAQITCPVESECPENVALMVAVEENRVGGCTGFLISQDVLVTASHCIPKDLRRESAPCKDRIRILFPSIKNVPAADAGCSEVLFATDLDPSPRSVQPDGAYVKLDRPVSRRVPQISAKGFAEGRRFSVAGVVLTSKTALIGELRSKSCVAVQRSFILPQFQSETAPLATLADCPIFPESSGSPVFDADGSIRGLIQSRSKTEDLTQSGLKYPVTGPISELAYVGSFSCMRLPFDAASSELPRECRSQPVSPLLLDSGFPLSPNLAADLQHKLDVWADKNSDYFKWTVRSSVGDPKNPSPSLYPRPLCIQDRDEESWKSHQRGFFSKKVKLKLQIPIWELKPAYNPYLQGVQAYVETRKILVEVTLNPSDIKKKGYADVRMQREKTQSEKSQTLFDEPLETCQ